MDMICKYLIQSCLLISLIGFTACNSGTSAEEEPASPQPQTPEQTHAGNPVFRDMYTADPAALVHNDTLYIFTGHDEQEAGGEGFVMNDWYVFSTTDMMNYTNHGARLQVADFGWASGQAWAAHVVEKGGKFYWYITAEHKDIPGKAIGVAVADHPLGPYTDAVGEALITNDMTTHTDIAWDDIDPAVFIDQDGSAYLYWGNTVLKYAKLKDNMTELDGPIHTLDLPAFTEGPWLFERQGKYYLTYSAQFPEVIDYAMADSPEGPWTYQGRLNDTVPNSPTNHQAVVEYKGAWYFIYHTGSLPNGGEFRRSVSIDRLHFNEDGTMQEIVQTVEGVERVE
ncbi:glycoside hydrolase family 43 protein [Roseivirga sp. BDSF3-8]|uniref:glycoside hydrolase family 43 protein n=1 Tax=Roseivirga sp. BDSF3-8 TaxID=3241598 RepID=UPI003531BB91